MTADREGVVQDTLAQIVVLAIDMEHREDCAFVTRRGNGVCDCGRNAIIQAANGALDA